MSWQKLDLDKETQFLSEAIDYNGVQADLITVINRMMENKIEDAVTEGAALLFYTNATNGYTKISWYNPKIEMFAGNVSYYLELKTLWNMSLKHEDGRISSTTKHMSAFAVLMKSILIILER